MTRWRHGVGTSVGVAAAVALFTFAGLVGAYYLVPGGSSAADVKNTTHELQCGHYALIRSCEMLGVPVSPETALQLLPYNSTGHNFSQLIGAFNSLGLRAEAYETNYENLIHSKPPIVAHVEPSHWVVVAYADAAVVILYDADGVRRAVSANVFRQSWSKTILRTTRETNAIVPVTPRSAPQDSPRIQFDTLVLDKAHDANPTGQFTFAFRNAGLGQLVIKSVRADCSCIRHSAPDTPILPGATGAVKLEYDANRMTGAFLHNVVVESNDPVTPTIKLTVASRGMGVPECRPDHLDFKNVVEGKASVTKVVAIYSDLELSSASPRVEFRSDHLRGFCIVAQSPEPVEGTPYRQLKPIGARSNHVVLVSVYAPNGFVGEATGSLKIWPGDQTGGSIDVPIHAKCISSIEPP